ncbi:UDP-glucose 4-epimerase family protein [Variovorax sp. VNK109]|uniref:UDP-glucose 4-epimerase family protein n=1 Tax=Variovorax sp. VNK109 TaxID=3400919 RepID=UPI003BFE60C1
MKILVTGATGFVGKALSNRLREDPTNTVVETSRSRKGPELAGGTDWSGLLAHVDCVVHAAARVHVMKESAADPLAEFRRVNVDGTLALARQAAKCGVRRFVFVSSVKVNGESTLPGRPFRETDVPAPQDSYGYSKHEAESALRELAGRTGIELVIVRPPLVYGPGVKGNFAALMRAVRRGWPLPLGAVNNQRSLVALDNLVDLLALCAVHPKAANETFMVSDGQDLSTTELVRGIAEAIARPARLIPVPPLLLRVGGAMAGRGEAVQRLCGNLQVDIGKAESVLSWTPQVAVAEGLRRAAAGLE